MVFALESLTVTKLDQNFIRNLVKNRRTRQNFGIYSLILLINPPPSNKPHFPFFLGCLKYEMQPLSSQFVATSPTHQAQLQQSNCENEKSNSETSFTTKETEPGLPPNGLPAGQNK